MRQHISKVLLLFLLAMQIYKYNFMLHRLSTISMIHYNKNHYVYKLGIENIQYFFITTIHFLLCLSDEGESDLALMEISASLEFAIEAT